MPHLKDILTLADLADHGLDVSTLRTWPIPEYRDDHGRPYWLIEDVLSIFQGDDKEMTRHDAQPFQAIWLELAHALAPITSDS